MDGSPKGSAFRNWLAASVLGAALAGGGYLVGLDSRPVPVAPPKEQGIPEEPAPELPVAVLGRAGLLQIANAAADRFSGGRNEAQAMAGRRFEIRLPFGCGPAGQSDRSSGWTYNEESGTLRISVTPNDWTASGWLSSAVPEGEVDAIEGFWVPRPWTTSDECPAGAQGDMGQSPSTLAIAHFFPAESDRSEQRRGRPFEFVDKIEPQAVPKRGLQLLLEGRIANVPGRRESVLCRAPDASVRPTCVVAAEYERIAVVDPATDTEIVNWRL